MSRQKSVEDAVAILAAALIAGIVLITYLWVAETGGAP